MKVSKFYNETFDTTLELVVFKHDDGKECKKVNKYLTSKNLDYSNSIENIDNSKAFCVVWNSSLISIIVDASKFKKDKKGIIELIKVLAHECNHFRQGVLDRIAEEVIKTDYEAHLRISDWAFKKCLGTKYFKSLLKK